MLNIHTLVNKIANAFLYSASIKILQRNTFYFKNIPYALKHIAM